MWKTAFKSLKRYGLSKADHTHFKGFTNVFHESYLTHSWILCHIWISVILSQRVTFTSSMTAQTMKISVKDFFSKSEQICRKLRICSHLLKISLTENFIFVQWMIQWYMLHLGDLQGQLVLLIHLIYLFVFHLIATVGLGCQDIYGVASPFVLPRLILKFSFLQWKGYQEYNSICWYSLQKLHIILQ